MNTYYKFTIQYLLDSYVKSTFNEFNKSSILTI